MVKRGDIWLVALDPTVGSEIQKTRPCLIVSPPELHDNLKLALVTPMTTGSYPMPFHVPIEFGGKRGLLVLEHTRAIDKRRLIRRLGTAPRLDVEEALARLRDFFVL